MKRESFQIQRGPRDLLDAWYTQTDPHIPLFYKASRVSHHIRNPQEVPAPSAHHSASQEGVPLVGLCNE